MCHEHLFLAVIATLVVQCVTAFKFKDEHLNKRLVSYTIANQTDLAMGLCARTCMLIQQCASLNYCMSTKTCELNALTSSEADPDDFVIDNDWNYAENTIWPQKMAGTCENKICEQNQECMPLLPEAVCKNLPGCSAPQPFAHSTLKPGGTLVNTMRVYTCDAGYAAIGGAPTIARVCQNDGNWTNEDEICHAICAPGSYSPVNVEPCTICPVNSYQPSQGQTECLLCPIDAITLTAGCTSASDCLTMCPAGSYSQVGVEPCANCEISSYQPSQGQTECVSCPVDTITLTTGCTSSSDCKALCSPGSYSLVNVEPCTICPVNSYQPSQGQAECLTCPIDAITLTAGSTSASDCLAMCPAGSYSQDGVEPCTNCEISSYQPSQGQTECLSCPVDTITQTTGCTSSSDCKALCTQGTYSLTAVEPCSICAVGFYQPYIGLTMCYECTTGQTTQFEGSTSESDCKSICPQGTYSPTALDPCTLCAFGFYQPYIGQTMCYECTTAQTTQFEGSTSDSDCKVRSISQWVSSVTDFSSEFEPVRFCADQIIGVYDTYPSYGDIDTSWAQLDFDANQFIEVMFDTPVFITGVDIYETYKSGGTKKVSARDSAGNLHVLWETSGITVIESSRIFSPSLTVFNSKSNQLRVDVDCTLADTWVEIDAFQLHGTLW